MSILFDDQDEPLLNLNDMDDEDDEPFRSCAPSTAFSATASTRSLGMPSSLLSQPLGLPIQSIARLIHDELTHNPEFVKYVDMVSHLQELLNLRRNPSTTTNYCYPESVVWTTKDCKTDPDVGGSASNSSRPPMHHAVRHENGKMISDPEWQSIRQAAFTVARSHLDPLRRDPRAIPEKMHKKTFMKGAFLNEWLDAVTALEHLCPLLSLCAGNWKGDMVLVSSHHPIPLRPAKSPLLPAPRLLAPPLPPVSPLAAPQSCPLVAPRSSPPILDRVHRHSHPRSQSRRARPAPRPSVGAIQARHGEMESVPKPTRVPVGHPRLPIQFNGHLPPAPPSCRYSNLTRPLNPSAEAAPSKTPRSKQDHATSRAKVPSTRAAKARGNRATVTDDDDMATKPVSGSRPVTPVEDPGCQSPSSKAKSNRSAVTDGDDDVAAQPVSGSRPVTPVEDPGCQSPRWGAQIQVRMATSSFENSSEPAPPLKTTHSKSDHASSSVKAPSTRAAKAKESLTAQVAFGDPAEDPGHESPDQAGMAPSLSEHSDDDDESHSHLQVLLRDELRQWVDEHKIESQGKRPTRIDLIKAIAGAAKSEQPSKEDIESIVTERKSKRNTKAA
ncbi:hypothetical protein EDB85DRAFT_2142721 [Lactarius pseudohatsudake]|nr:hypothetical protein EDB85DRAFT_2142721 [Lactarius pseudohatsudake]